MATDSEPRLTFQSMKVLKALLEVRGYRAAGADLMKSAQLPSGTLYPILLRFVEAGLLRSEWETENPQELGRPRRRYYTLTGEGQKVARTALGHFAAPALMPGILRLLGVMP